MAKTEIIERHILLVRGQKVILDFALAGMYRVSTGNLNLAVHRNIERFPPDFMFQLTPKEAANLRLQFARSSWGGRRSAPYAFTEHGVAMLSSVLKSAFAVKFNILIMRAFIHLRDLLEGDKELARKIDLLEHGQAYQGQQIVSIYRAVNRMIKGPRTPKRKYGFPTARIEAAKPRLLPAPQGSSKKSPKPDDET